MNCESALVGVKENPIIVIELYQARRVWAQIQRRDGAIVPPAIDNGNRTTFQNNTSKLVFNI